MIDVLTPNEWWEQYYKFHPVLIREGVMFSQFQERFKDHCKQITEKKMKSMNDLKAYEHYCHMNPSKTHDSNGQLIFDAHPAKLLLREDIKIGKQKTMPPAALQGTRKEYCDFPLSIF